MKSEGAYRTLLKFIALTILVALLGGCNMPAMYAKQAPADNSQLVRDVQVMLSEKGFNPGPADGVVGKRTLSALEEFQRDRGLSPTNGVTPDAWGQLKADLPSYAPAFSLKVAQPDSASVSSSSAAGTATAENGANLNSSGIGRANNSSTGQGSYMPILISSVPAPTNSPPNNVIEDEVRKKLQSSIPERWIQYGKPGQDAKFHHMEIVKWGAYNKEAGYFPVKIRVAGNTTVYDLMFKPLQKSFDEVAEFRFKKDDYGDWQSAFLRPGVFGGGQWVE
jgi:peptidoglycan hydrolase-like protein with peptidoglycan-binding domain